MATEKTLNNIMDEFFTKHYGNYGLSPYLNYIFFNKILGCPTTGEVQMVAVYSDSLQSLLWVLTGISLTLKAYGEWTEKEEVEMANDFENLMDLLLVSQEH